ncbi:MAG: rhodanese-like domain-containing protein [Cellvibrionales bacterium]|jgi:phage shock protein E
MKYLVMLTAALMLVACGSEQPVGDSDQVLEKIAAGATVIDVRTTLEQDGGMLPGALPILHTAIVDGVAALAIPKDQPLVLYCRSGRRSGLAAAALRDAGYTEVTNGGGYADLKAAMAR